MSDQSTRRDRLARIQGTGINGSQSRGSESSTRERRGAQREQELAQRFDPEVFKLDAEGRVTTIPTEETPERLVVFSPGSDYTALLSEDVLLANATLGPMTINLPTAVGNKGKRFYIKKIAPADPADTVTIDPYGSEEVDDGATAVIDVQYTSLTLVSDGANWWIV